MVVDLLEMSRCATGSHASAPQPDPCTLSAASVSWLEDGHEPNDSRWRQPVPRRLAAAVRAHVPPEERVQDVPGKMEGEVLL